MCRSIYLIPSNQQAQKVFFLLVYQESNAPNLLLNRVLSMASSAYDGTAKFSSRHECEHENQDHGKATSPTTAPPAMAIVTTVHINQFLMMTPSQILRMSEEQAEGARGSTLGRVPATNQTTPRRLSSDTKPYLA